MASNPNFPGVSPFDVDEKRHRRAMAKAINQLTQAKFNCTLAVTLNANQTSTQVVDARIGVGSAILWTPLTAHAATAGQSMYVTNQLPAINTTPGSLTLNHPNTANTDQNFTLTILG